jgi:hypothetical protein
MCLVPIAMTKGWEGLSLAVFVKATEDILGPAPVKSSGGVPVRTRRTPWEPLVEERVLTCPHRHRVQLSPSRAARLADQALASGLDEMLIDF